MIVARQTRSAGATIKVLKLPVEHHGSILVTEDMLRTFQNSELLEFLLRERLTCQIAPGILEAAAVK